MTRAGLALLLVVALGLQAGAAAAAETTTAVDPARDLVFALDASGSMRMEKFDAVKLAFENMSRALSPTDRFTVFTFSAPPDWWIDMWNDSLQPATPESLAAARGFVDNSGTSGSSNILSALQRAFGRFEPGANRERIVVLVSDGISNSGPVGADNLVPQVVKADAPGACVFTVPVGDDADRGLLTRLADVTHGRLVELQNASAEVGKFRCSPHAWTPVPDVVNAPVSVQPYATAAQPAAPSGPQAGFRVALGAPLAAALPEPLTAASILGAMIAGALVAALAGGACLTLRGRK